jgi:gas vesicle structural protein
MSDELLPFDERLRLVELVDRVLDRGVVLKGDVMISVAGVDLVYLQLQVLLSAVENFQRERGELTP